MFLTCLAIALYDVDGPVRCATGERIRLSGIGATELDGRTRPGQPGVPGDPYAQRRRLAVAIGAEIAQDDRGPGGHLWFLRPVRLRCEITGTSYNRLTALCRLPDGRDLSCTAIAIDVAKRWPRFDPDGRLNGCADRRKR